MIPWLEEVMAKADDKPLGWSISYERLLALFRIAEEAQKAVSGGDEVFIWDLREAVDAAEKVE